MNQRYDLVFTAIEATTEVLIQEALRLRYEVFYREEGDARYADHDGEIWTDQDDGPQSRIVVGLDSSGDVVGTMRMTRLCDWPFIAHEAYDFALLASLVGLSEAELRRTVVRADRGVVSRRCRGSGLLSKMQCQFDQMARDAGCTIIVGNPRVDNMASRRAFQKLGWIEYPHVSTYKGFTAQHIYKDLRSLSDIR